MRLISVWPMVLGLALAMIVVTVVRPVNGSLAYASALVVVIALAGWALEARAAGRGVLLEEAERTEEEAGGLSLWPLVLALGIAGIAAGLVLHWRYGSLLVALPMAFAAAAAWARAIREERAGAAAEHPWFVPAQPVAGPPSMGTSKALTQPLAQSVLEAERSAGAAIAVEERGRRGFSRRTFLGTSFWVALGAGLAGFAASLVDMLYPRGVSGFGGLVSAGTVDQFPPSTMTQVPEGKFWLVHLTEEQAKMSFAGAKGGLLALWWKCPHLGCTVPWRPEFTWPDSAGNPRRGWFRCPCHGSTYDHAGMRVYGPAPRSLDRMQLTIDPGSRLITVDTGKISKGSPDNAKYAVPV